MAMLEIKEGTSQNVTASGGGWEKEEKATICITQDARKQMQYSNWIIKVHLTKGLFNKAWAGFREIKWIQSTPTAGRNAIPRPKEARGAITRAEEGSCTERAPAVTSSRGTSPLHSNPAARNQRENTLISRSTLPPVP